MLGIYRRNLAGLGLIALIVVASSLTALTLNSAGREESPNTKNVPPVYTPPLGLLLVNATYSISDIERPITGAAVSVLLMPAGRLVASNDTDSSGMLSLFLHTGTYKVSIDSVYGSSSSEVTILGNKTTVFAYSALNESATAVGFDIVSQEAGIVTTWDAIYLDLPNTIAATNFSGASIFLEPSYTSRSNSFSLNATISRATMILVQSQVVSQGPQTSEGFAWLQVHPLISFSTDGLNGFSILAFKSQVQVNVENGFLHFK